MYLSREELLWARRVKSHFVMVMVTEGPEMGGWTRVQRNWRKLQYRMVCIEVHIYFQENHQIEVVRFSKGFVNYKKIRTIAVGDQFNQSSKIREVTEGTGRKAISGSGENAAQAKKHTEREKRKAYWKWF